MVKLKICRKCKIEKDYTDFPRDKYTKDGFTASCKECRYEKSKKWSQKNYLINKNEILNKNSKWRKDNWEKVYKQRKESGYCKRSRKKWYHNKGKFNINWIISERIRSRVRNVLNGKVKSKSTLELLGCTIEQVKERLESKFRDGMSWQNYGSYWHIDHIRPCASFNLENEEEQKKCFHYYNLQPLTAKENLIKGAKFLQ
jgi:hypothetical protein